MVVGQKDDNFFICRGFLLLYQQPHNFSADIFSLSKYPSVLNGQILYSILLLYPTNLSITSAPCKIHLHIALCVGAFDTKFAFPLTKGWGTKEHLNFREVTAL